MCTRTDAIKEGFEVYPVIDCVGGTSPEAHELGVQRLVQAALNRGWVQLIYELQRDWNREKTRPVLQTFFSRLGPLTGADREPG